MPDKKDPGRQTARVLQFMVVIAADQVKPIALKVRSRYTNHGRRLHLMARRFALHTKNGFSDHFLFTHLRVAFAVSYSRPVLREYKS